MGAEQDIIVAIELGSSAIRGIAGQKGPDGNMKILAIEQENVKECVHRGVIFNIDKTTRAIRLIKDRLEEKLNANITRAYVGLSGQSLHTVSNKILHDLGQYVKITSSHIDRLMDENHNTQYPKRVILETIPQEYLVDNNRTNEPEGIQGSQIEGNFLNIISLATLRDNILKCLKEANIALAELLISPLELAKHLLPDSEKRSGCVLVDMGAETTTVSIYSDNLLRHLVVIPLGGKNVNKDICTVCNVGIEEAETLKTKNAVAFVAKNGSEDDVKRTVSLSNDRVCNVAELQEIVSARIEEIIRNVWNQVENSQWRDKLLSGIVLTGGAASQPQMIDAFKTITTYDKVKMARCLMETTTSTPGIGANDDISLNTLIALMLSGNESCAVEKVATPVEPVIEPVVNEDKTPATPNTPYQDTSSPEDELIIEDEEKEEEEPTPKKKKTNFFTRVGNIITTMVNEDEED